MTTRTFQISIPTDAKGFVGRQCTKSDCKKYFKVKPGTGVPTPARGFCPYCGHVDDPGDFWTEEQKKYALSVVGRQVMGEVAQQLKKHEFDIPARGAFGIGFSLKIRHTPEPIRYYVEQDIETPLTCERCTLDYAIYGVFAFCPDCGAHNSLQILQKNFEVISKLIRLGDTANDQELADQLLSDALENAVSAFDGFGREVCRIAAARSADPTRTASISFQRGSSRWSLLHPVLRRARSSTRSRRNRLAALSGTEMGRPRTRRSVGAAMGHCARRSRRVAGCAHRERA